MWKFLSNLLGSSDTASVVKASEAIPLSSTPGHKEVEFVARARLAGRGQRLHERSRFVREEGHWFYVDGDLLA